MPLVRYPSSHGGNDQGEVDVARLEGGILMTTHFTAEITVAAEGVNNFISIHEYP